MVSPGDLRAGKTRHQRTESLVDGGDWKSQAAGRLAAMERAYRNRIRNSRGQNPGVVDKVSTLFCVQGLEPWVTEGFKGV